MGEKNTNFWSKTAPFPESLENILSGVLDYVFGSWQESLEFFCKKRIKFARIHIIEPKIMIKTWIFLIFKNPINGSKWRPLTWLAMMFLFLSYLSYFKSDFYCVKGIVDLFNLYKVTSKQADSSSPRNALATCNIFGHISAVVSRILMGWKAKLSFGLPNW